MFTFSGWYQFYNVAFFTAAKAKAQEPIHFKKKAILESYKEDDNAADKTEASSTDPAPSAGTAAEPQPAQQPEAKQGKCQVFTDKTQRIVVHGYTSDGTLFQCRTHLSNFRKLYSCT